MLTKLNEAVENFFQLTGKDFNYEEIQKNFDFDGKDENEYGNLLHAALHQHFDEERDCSKINVNFLWSYN